MGIRCDGDLMQDASGAPLCSGTWIEEPDQLSQLYELLNAAFSTPDPAQIVGAFMAALTVPLIAYLAAWAYGKVVSFAGQDESNLQ